MLPSGAVAVHWIFRGVFWTQWNIFNKSSNLDVWQSSEHASDISEVLSYLFSKIFFQFHSWKYQDYDFITKNEIADLS